MRYAWHRFKENVQLWISSHMPRSIAYWCAIRVMTYKYGGSPSDRSCADALKAWVK